MGFKADLVDLVAPPPDYGEESGAEDGTKSPKPKPQEDKEDKDKDKDKDKVDDKSESISGSKKSNGKKDSVLIEIDGQFQLVDSDDVRAKDLGLGPALVDKSKDSKNTKDSKDSKDSKNDKENQNKGRQPAPPSKPRPATASVSTRRNVRTLPEKSRPSSAHATIDHGSVLHDFNYNSPYALSPREKQLMEERRKAQEKQRQDQEKKKKEEDEEKERENRSAFESWLKKKREADRRQKINNEEERRQNDKEDRVRTNSWCSCARGMLAGCGTSVVAR